ncbi:hypothetical protein N9B73_03470 [Verrucomicrobiales bacterium]|nr:hypothetical protein [Verrucomicrobiales bacterium]
MAAPSSKFDKNAQRLAKSLASTPAAKKANPADLKKLKGQMITIIEIIEQSDRSGSTNAESVVDKAMFFREDMGDYEKMVAANAIINAWENARHYGLFNESGKFEDRISRGRHSGDPAIFELIVPAERYPKGSNQLSNLRIVALKEKRQDGEEMDPRDLAFGHQLVKVINEKQSFGAMQKREATIATSAIGETKEQSQASWERAVKESEGALDRVPRIRIESSINGSPSKGNQYRWRLVGNIRNQSVHPTDVTISVYMLGQTEKKRAYYIMAKKDFSLKLRANEIREIETFTKPESTYKHKAGTLDGMPPKQAKNGKVDYRGNIVIAKHKDKVIAIHGSDARLLNFADAENKDLSLGDIPSFF